MPELAHCERCFSPLDACHCEVGEFAELSPSQLYEANGVIEHPGEGSLPLTLSFLGLARQKPEDL